ncbi:MAG: hypothetical protein HQM03_18340 [Magnetococcales bacterium]|nr:hypothetical protein [Magnetococcales bacterium]
MPRQKPVKKIRAQARAAAKRNARSRRSQHPKANQPSEAIARMDTDLACLVEQSSISQREITDEEEEEFLQQVLDVNARAIAHNSGVKEREARVVLEALVHAGAMQLRDDLHLVPVKTLEGLVGDQSTVSSNGSSS